MGNSLRPGDAVVVRPAGEILRTLDAEGTLAAMPFMPEMLQFLGRRAMVSKVAQKVCDTIKYTGSRELLDTVLLDDLRCDGGAHDGCQAECRYYWKEAWLRRAEPSDPAAGEAGTPEEISALRERLAAHTRRTSAEGSTEPIYRCQATDLLLATRRYRLWEPGQYVREVTNGNVTPGRFVRVMGRALVWETRRKLGFLPEVHVAGTRQEPVRDEEVLNLQPGEWVEIKQGVDLREQLTPHGRNRGLWFDWEMERYCGGRYQVRSRVARFIDDRTSKMVHLKTDAVTLDGVTCTGNFSSRRWFCPRAVYPYWRESWLRRVDGPGRDRASGAPAKGAPQGGDVGGAGKSQDE